MGTMRALMGDMAVKDLTPRTENIGGRLVKNMRICGSGIYHYGRSEASILGLEPIPEKYKDLSIISVYRPPEVLERCKDYFARIPIITGSHVKVDQDNAKRLAVGMVGDTVKTEVDDDGELYLYTTGTIIAGDGADAYENLGELSVGYSPVIEWEEGEHNGEKYQAVLKDFDDVNHLLICRTARGGHQCTFMDSLDGIIKNGGNKMGIFKKIFGSRPLTGDSAVVSALLQSISVGADPKTQVDRIKEIVGDSDETFTGYLDELAQGKDADPAVMSKAVDIVDNYYKEKMAGDSCMMSDKITREKKKEAAEKEAGDTAVPIDAVHALANDKKKKEAEAKKEEVEGDAKACGDSIDYELLAKNIVACMNKVEEVPGDEKEEEAEPYEGADIPVTGDTATKNDSNFFMNEIFGGL